MGDLIGIAILIAISALFAMSEIAIAAARKIKLRVMAEEGDVKAQAVLTLQENPGAFFAMIQIALNAIAIMGGIVGEQALSPYIAEFVSLFYVGPLAEQISFFFSFFAITSLFILFADLLPKRIAMIMPETMAMKLVLLMNAVTYALKPLVILFNGISNLVLRIMNLPTEREEIVTTEDIVAMMDAGAEYGSLQQQEYHLIGNVFELEGRTLPTAMTTREYLVYFDIDDDSETISAKILEHPHNHFLICDGSLDKLVGSVESKEILRQLLKGDPVSLKEEIIDKDLFYLPETLTLSEALNAFKAAARPFAIVVNEYAMVVGMVTVKDLMSSFMGNLVTFHGEEQIVQRDANSWLVDGATPIVDLMRLLEIESFPNNSQYETVAGFLIYMLKRLAKRTDYVIHEGFKFEAIDVEGIRVEQLLVSRVVEAVIIPDEKIS
ncbi:hemolysin family protein [Pseudoalteromonas tunicata]|uniref:hemolysin family protein n=1 Tax=Pseudoalteromonas tunicata TaxID=314281 RepID=UPI00273FB82E|nr:hemolysin family protein [Pseudoalteromonas tunicata]MDP4984407.1 hemolysin family protein [Pseudoalteromonas tunicata]MDP5212888.1 hemolysin family protein [Pseudoalteromonas tunicata]